MTEPITGWQALLMITVWQLTWHSLDMAAFFIRRWRKEQNQATKREVLEAQIRELHRIQTMAERINPVFRSEGTLH